MSVSFFPVSFLFVCFYPVTFFTVGAAAAAILKEVQRGV